MIFKKKNKAVLPGVDTRLAHTEVQVSNEPAAPVPAAPRGAVDHLVLHNNMLMLFGWEVSETDLVYIEVDNHRVELSDQNCLMRYRREDVVALLDATDGSSASHGYIIRCDLPNIDAEIDVGQSVNCELGFKAGATLAAANLKIHSINTIRKYEIFDTVCDDDSIANFKRLVGENSALVVDLLEERRFGHLHIEKEFWLNEKALFLTGWSQNAAHCRVVCEAIDGPAYEDIYIDYLARNDVNTHLEQFDLKLLSVEHGFSCYVLFPENVDMPDRIRIAFLDEDSDKTIVSMIVEKKNASRFKDILPEHLSIATQNRVLPSSNLAMGIVALHQRYLASKKHMVERVRVFGEALQTCLPKVSIIVPFYKEDFFVHHLVQMQLDAPDYVEWVFVCDDPGLMRSLEKHLENKLLMFRQKTSFVVLESNVGFAMANNIGLQYAHGEHILLMNSDIYSDSFAWLDYSLKLFEQEKDIGAVGYTLCFEDGTIQHDGMSFVKDPLYEDNYLTLHPGKGFPVSWEGLSHRPVQACTAALLLVSRKDFETKLFSNEYVIGDFEDSDLNMHLKSQGKQILIVETSGIYHLERQSIRNLGANTFRSHITLLNCKTFNYKWKDMLDSEEALQ